MSNEKWVHPMRATEYHGLNKCCCNKSEPVMMSEIKFIGNLNGTRMGSISAYVCCLGCGRRTMNVEFISDITFEDYCMVKNRTAKIWNEHTSKH